MTTALDILLELYREGEIDACDRAGGSFQAGCYTDSHLALHSKLLNMGVDKEVLNAIEAEVWGALAE